MDNGTEKNYHNGRGKPSKQKQLEIERELRSLFIDDVSPYHAAIKTGYSINTVKKYYRKFYKEIRDLEGQNFAQECKDRIVSACFSIDKEISNLRKMQKELEFKSQTDGTQYIQLYKLQISLSNSISDLIMKRLGIANSPTYDDMLAAMRKEGEQK